MRARSLLATLSLFPLLSACFVIDKIRGEDDEDAAGGTGEAEAEQPAEAKDPTEETGEKARPAPVTGIDRFKHWTPRHVYLGAPTFTAQVLSDSEIIVATLDAHIGVSKDAGKTWQW